MLRITNIKNSQNKSYNHNLFFLAYILLTQVLSFGYIKFLGIPSKMLTVALLVFFSVVFHHCI